MAEGPVSWFAGARQVASGPYPLYRLLIIAVIVACILQFWLGVPASVALAAGTTVPLDTLFLCFQAAGSIIVLCSFYVRQAMLSLQLERFGCIALCTSGFIYFAAALIVLSGPVPVSSAIWCSLFFAFYLTRRAFYEIPYNISEVRKAAKQLLGKE